MFAEPDKTMSSSLVRARMNLACRYVPASGALTTWTAARPGYLLRTRASACGSALVSCSWTSIRAYEGAIWPSRRLRAAQAGS